MPRVPRIQCEKAVYHIKQRVKEPPKYYAIDTGLAAANSPTFDLGRNAPWRSPQQETIFVNNF